MVLRRVGTDLDGGAAVAVVVVVDVVAVPGPVRCGPRDAEPADLDQSETWVKRSDVTVVERFIVMIEVTRSQKISGLNERRCCRCSLSGAALLAVVYLRCRRSKTGLTWKVQPRQCHTKDYEDTTKGVVRFNGRMG